MKRRRDEDLGVIPSAKKQKQEDLAAIPKDLGATPIDYLSILNPLIDNSKLQINGANYNDNFETLGDFLNKENDSITIQQKELGQFITSQLAAFKKNIPNNKAFDSFNKLNIRTSPTGAKDKIGYDPNNRSISLNTYEDEYDNLNPLITLIHEGTHALDNLYMRNSQDAAVNTLAKMERAKEGRAERNLLSNNNRLWYTQAQNILNIPSFSARYSLSGHEEDDHKLDNSYLKTFDDLNEVPRG